MHNIKRYLALLFLLATVIAYQAHGIRNKPLKNNMNKSQKLIHTQEKYAPVVTPEPGQQSLQQLQDNQQQIAELKERLARSNQTLSIAQTNTQNLNNRLQQVQDANSVLTEEKKKYISFTEQLKSALKESNERQAQYLEELFTEQEKNKDLELLRAQLIEKDEKSSNRLHAQNQAEIALEKANEELAALRQELLACQPNKKNLVHLQKELTASIQERNELKELICQEDLLKKSLQEICEKATKENEQLATLLAKTERKLGEVNRTNRHASEEMRKQHNQEMQELSLKIALIEDKMQNATEAARDRETEIINAARMKLKEMKDEQILLTQNLEKQQKEYTQATSILEEQLDKACMQLAHAQENIAAQQSSDTQAQQKIQQLVQENTHLENLLALSESNAQDTEKRIALLHNDLLTKEDKYVAALAAAEQTEQELKNMQYMRDEYAFLQKNAEDSAQALALVQQECDLSKAEQDSLRFELDDIKRRWYECQAELTCTQEERNRHAQAASNLMQQLQNQEQVYQEKLLLAKERELSAVNQGKEAIEQVLKKAKNTFAQCKSSYEKLRSERKQESKQYKQACTQLEEAQEKLTATEQMRTQETAALQEEIDALKSEQRNLHASAAELTQQLQDCEIYWQNELQASMAYNQEQLEQTQAAYEAKLAHMQQKEEELRQKGKRTVKKITALAQTKMMHLKQEHEKMRLELAAMQQEKNAALKDHMEQQLITLDTKLSALNSQPQEELFS